MELGLVRKVDIDHEMQQSYLDYAMSVIVQRALPDARDGLKPVQRRILYAMYDMGLRPESSYKKSARIVGEVLGKYHPHGDQSVYDAMARLAQDFSMRYLLVDGQGNFGSVDGDPPAAMRYTEAKLTPFAISLLSQLDRNTIDFQNNFDESLKEPAVLPAAAPNLLVNGASGIAVGMATNIPPHNLTEVIDALLYVLSEWEKLEDITVSDLMQYIKGPDFPTGGIILQEDQQEDLLTAYATGRGRITLRGRVMVEEMGRGKSRIILTELPYQVNKSSLIERIAELVREGAVDGISDLRDESDRHGMRIVIELNKVAEEENVLRELYKRTPLQVTFGISLLALVDGEPRLLTLKQALKVYIEHRLVVVKRRSEYDLNKAQERLHIVEGLRIAIKFLDEVIAIIRGSQDADQAKQRLMKQFKLSELQTQAILDMPLRRLAALERKKIEQEYKDLITVIKDLEALLKSPKKMRALVGEELQAIKQLYGDRRRTQIVSLKAGVTVKDQLVPADLTPEEPVWVGITEDGHICRTHSDDLPRVSGLQAPHWLIRATTRHTLYLVAEDGRTAAVAVSTLPEGEKFSDGAPIDKASAFDRDAALAAIFSLPPRSELPENTCITTISRAGLVKKTSVHELPGPSAQMFVLTKVNARDAVGWAFLTNGENDLLIVSRQGLAIRFSENEVRPMGLVAAGVNGIKLGAADEVIAAGRVDDSMEWLMVAVDGSAWRMKGEDFPVQGRYGQGVIAVKMKAGGRLAGCLAGKPNQTGLLHFQKGASKTIRVDEVVLGKRAAAGKPLGAAPLKPGESVLSITTIEDGLQFWEKRKTGARKPRAEKKPLQPALIPETAEPPASAVKKPRTKTTVTPSKKPVAATKKPAADQKKPAAAKKVPTKAQKPKAK